MIPEDILETLRSNPLDPHAHESLGNSYGAQHDYLRAASSYRTGMALGGSEPGLIHLKYVLALANLGRIEMASSVLEEVRDSMPPLLRAQSDKLVTTLSSLPAVPLMGMDHNRYYRMKTLAQFIIRAVGDDRFDMLDVGGADGALAMFLPRTSYMLVEPDTNGISGLALPFPEKSVDVVCACHVLEHIPPQDRFKFLDQLCAHARSHLVLLNPFRVEGTHYQERLKLMIQLTSADWAKQHLECGLPEVKDMEEYASSRDLGVQIQPNGALPVGFLLSLVTHYAHLADHSGDLPAINSYLNSLEPDRITNPNLPGAYLVHFDLTAS